MSDVGTDRPSPTPGGGLAPVGHHPKERARAPGLRRHRRHRTCLGAPPSRTQKAPRGRHQCRWCLSVARHDDASRGCNEAAVSPAHDSHQRSQEHKADDQRCCVRRDPRCDERTFRSSWRGGRSRLRRWGCRGRVVIECRSRRRRVQMRRPRDGQRSRQPRNSRLGGGRRSPAMHRRRSEAATRAPQLLNANSC